LAFYLLDEVLIKFNNMLVVPAVCAQERGRSSGSLRTMENPAMSDANHYKCATKADILAALSLFARPSTARGLAIFFAEYLAYWAAIAAVLWAPWLLVKILASLFAGVKLSAFVTLGHDAAHRTLVANRRMNWWLAVLLFIPCAHNYRLWIWDHHEVHHPETNGDHFDSYTPYSKQEFERLPWHLQWFERLIRSRSFIGFGLHYLLQRMSSVRIFPRTMVPARHRVSAWRHFAVLLIFHIIFIACLLSAPAFAPVSMAQALLLGYALPLFLFACLTGGSLYLMHTHPAVPWFKGELDRRGAGAAELCSTHLALPKTVSRLVHNVFAHSAHHAHAGIPSYRLLEAQAVLDGLLGAHAVSEPMRLSGVLQTLKTCKLYDFEKHQWLDFAGAPTTAPLVMTTAATNHPTAEIEYRVVA
jgi:acyl-lipid omega-6 desaturase (Delta-12 desaturase)